jgi:phenylalanine-4-hydroxylase
MTVGPSFRNIPTYLKQFVVDQHYERYTARDHAIWRYVMKKNLKYLSKHAHRAYLRGLETTGISTGHIPSMEEMNRALQKIGWQAVCVDGFIPPSHFMSFQRYKILVIAADIRPEEQIEYTPAPDIIHEAAGHAPLIADKAYADYLVRFGELGSSAFDSENDRIIYEAIRHLSILKSRPDSSKEAIRQAQNAIKVAEEKNTDLSELARLRNLHWWTVEYGLIGDLSHPKLYGAGLLSSIKESQLALSSQVKKLRYTLEAQHYAFDITKPQPQLFVTPDFKWLSEVLEDFAKNMAVKKGGVKGILKAVDSKKPATVELDSGLQITGVFSDVLVHQGKAVYINTQGATRLSFESQMLEGHSEEFHRDGYGTPLGLLKGSNRCLCTFDDIDLSTFGIQKGKHCRIEFLSGVLLEGTLLSIVRKKGKIILLRFTDCTVKHLNKTLFEPSWGQFDMGIGSQIVSAYPNLPESEC